MKISTNLTDAEVVSRLEDICRKAYDADLEEVKHLIVEVHKLASMGRPYLCDAVITQLFWVMECLVVTDVGAPGVYVIEYGAGSIKIGKTVNFQDRLKTLASMSPKAPSRTHFQPVVDHSKVESRMHKHFSEARGHGEFFSLDFDVAVAALSVIAKEVQQ